VRGGGFVFWDDFGVEEENLKKLGKTRVLTLMFCHGVKVIDVYYKKERSDEIWKRIDRVEDKSDKSDKNEMVKKWEFGAGWE